MSDYILPYHGQIKITSRFGDRTLYQQSEFHNGIDLVGLESKAIISPCDGVVKSSTIILDKTNKTWEWGNYVRIDDDKFSFFLCHLSERLVVKGQKVYKGQPIGYEGETGLAYGNHLHLEVRSDETVINPCKIFNIANEIGVIIKNKSENNEGHSWSYEAISWAIKNGILRGYSEDNADYRLNENITREEMIVLLYRLYEYLF